MITIRKKIIKRNLPTITNLGRDTAIKSLFTKLRKSLMRIYIDICYFYKRYKKSSVSFSNLFNFIFFLDGIRVRGGFFAVHDFVG